MTSLQVNTGNKRRFVIKRDEHNYVILPSDLFDPIKYTKMTASDLMERSIYWQHINTTMSSTIVDKNPFHYTPLDIEAFQNDFNAFVRDCYDRGEKEVEKRIVANAVKAGLIISHECANQEPKNLFDVLSCFKSSRMIDMFRNDPGDYCNVLYKCVWKLFESGDDGDDDWMMEVARKFCEEKKFSTSNIGRCDATGTRKHCLIRLIALLANSVKKDFSRVMERHFNCSFRTKLRREKTSDDKRDEAHVTVRVELKDCKDEKKLFYLRMSKAFIAEQPLLLSKLSINIISWAKAMKLDKETFFDRLRLDWDGYDGNT